MLEEIRKRYDSQVSFQLLLGGLRPGNTERFDESRRTYILQHWKAVHARTGQLFNFDFAMDPTFTYDTEPASRAVALTRKLMPGKEWELFKRVQEAFYVDNADVTKGECLEELATPLGMDASSFRELFQLPETKQEVWEDFDQARQLGVDGFPTLIGRNGSLVATLMHGYQDMKALVPSIDRFLEKID